MLMVAQERVRPARLWTRMRVQLGGGFLFAAAIPIAVLRYTTEEIPVSVVQQSGTGVLISIILGYYFLRSITVFPGMRTNLRSPCFSFFAWITAAARS